MFLHLSSLAPSLKGELCPNAGTNREPTQEWSQIRPLLKESAQIKYELIRPCGRILALNRQLYHLQMPRSADHTKKELSFQSAYRHHYWFVDIRYLDMHHLGGEMIYCISILEGYSRAILA